MVISATLACAAVMFKALPEKLTPVVKPLMVSLACEQDPNLQKITAEHLAILLDLVRTREINPYNKVISRLCDFLR